MEEQAEPEETATIDFKPKSRAEPSIPSILTFRLPDSLFVGCPLRVIPSKD